jgi:hypothetical protein
MGRGWGARLLLGEEGSLGYTVSTERRSSVTGATKLSFSEGFLVLLFVSFLSCEAVPFFVLRLERVGICEVLLVCDHWH